MIERGKSWEELAVEFETDDQEFKFDNKKDRWDLVPIKSMTAVVKVLSFGATKYSDNSWKKVNNFDERYYASLMRHLAAWRRGEKIDEESGLPHLAHAATCCFFLLWNHLK